MGEVKQYILSDYYRYYGEITPFYKLVLKALIARNHCFTYTFWLRLASQRSWIYPLARWKHYRLSRKYGIQISPFSKIGYGFYIGHGVGIVINPATEIGNNCNVSQFLSIGLNKGTPAKIGDNVYIGPNVCIVEDVQIGDNVTIGAGAVVLEDIQNNATAVGVSAQTLHFENSAQYIVNRWTKII